MEVRQVLHDEDVDVDDDRRFSFLDRGGDGDFHSNHSVW